MKKILVLMFGALFLLTGCGKANDIKDGKVSSVKGDIISTSVDNENIFTLVPITTYNGENISISYLPMWNEEEYLTVHYSYKNKKYSTKTSDFEVVKTKDKRYVRIAKKDIGKKDAAIVLYTK